MLKEDTKEELEVPPPMAGLTFYVAEVRRWRSASGHCLRVLIDGGFPQGRAKFQSNATKQFCIFHREVVIPRLRTTGCRLNGCRAIGQFRMAFSGGKALEP